MTALLMMFQSSLGHSGGVQEDVVLTVGVLVEGELRRVREERKGEERRGGMRGRGKGGGEGRRGEEERGGKKEKRNGEGGGGSK